MVGICFYFEENDVDVWSGRRIDLDAWHYAAKAAGDIDEYVVVNRTPVKLESPDVDVKFTVVEVLPELFGDVVHVCCPWDEADEVTSLWDFDHNIDWYVFGPASGWKTNVGRGLYVPVCGNISLHSMHIASVVMLHRYHVIGGV